MIFTVPLLAEIGSFFVGLWVALKSWFVWLFGVYFVGKIVQILLSLGIGYATYELGGFGLNVLYSKVIANLSGVPSDALGFLSRAGVFEALSILFGALSARLVITGVTKLTHRR